MPHKHKVPLVAPALEEQALVLGAISAVNNSSMAHFSETRPSLSGKQAWAVGSAPLGSRWEPADIPKSVLNTVLQARAPSTRCLYALKWSVFSAELLDKGRSPSILKVYVAAIAAFHAPISLTVSRLEQPSCLLSEGVREA